MTFEWDEAKNRAVLGKYGLDFESARRVTARERKA
jgi:uncharacterized DUF497 family protein